MDRENNPFFEEENDTAEMAAQNERQVAPAAQPNYESDDDHTYLMKLLDYLQDAMEFGSVVPLTGKRLVDANMCIDIIKDIRGNLPLAIQYAEQVMRDRERILTNAERTASNKLAGADSRADAVIKEADAHAQQIINEAEDRADKIIKSAEIHARGLIDQHAIKVAAQNEGRDIVNAARAEANDKRQAASAYCEDMHLNTEKALQHAMDIVRGHRQSLSENR